MYLTNIWNYTSWFTAIAIIALISVFVGFIVYQPERPNRHGIRTSDVWIWMVGVGAVATFIFVFGALATNSDVDQTIAKSRPMTILHEKGNVSTSSDDVQLDGHVLAKIEKSSNTANLVSTTDSGKAMIAVLKYVNHSNKYVESIKVRPYGTFVKYADSTGNHKAACYVNNAKPKKNDKIIILNYK